jgi:hypothetical protein
VVETLQTEGLRRVVAQRDVLEGRVVDRSQLFRRLGVEVGDVDPLDADRHTATSWR